MFIINLIKSIFTLFLNKLRWRSMNGHNDTGIVNVFPLEDVTVGRGTYGTLRVLDFNAGQSKLKIGNFCSVAEDVTFVLNAEHKIDTVTTFPFLVKYFHAEGESFDHGDIVLDDDVWIGYRATIMSGVHIGQGAVVAANAVVTKDVAPYTIVGGVPARPIRKRFDDEVCRILLDRLDWSKVNVEALESNKDILYEKITVDNVEKVVSVLNGAK